MPEPKRPLKVFLCHAHSDKDKVRSLYLRLKREGVDAWLDKEKLLPGSDWELEIRKAVREADVVVVCLSKQFNQAGFRQKEVRIALDTAMEQPEGEIFIIPARLEECENLESLSRWHWVDLFEDDGYMSLIRALRTRADRIGATLRIRKGGQAITARPKNKEPEKTIEPSISNIDIGYTVSADAIVTEIQETQSLEKAELEAAEKVVLEKAEKDAAEKTRLEIEEQTRQKAAKERAEGEAAKKLARDKTEKDAIEKAWLEAAEKASPKKEEQKTIQEPEQKKVTLESIEEESAREPNPIESKKPAPPNLKKTRSPRKWNKAIIVVTGLVSMIIAVFISLPMLTDVFNPPLPTVDPARVNTFIAQTDQALSPLPSVAATDTFVPTETTTHTPISSETSIVPTSLPTEITDAKGVPMMFVPAGEFIMGKDDGEDYTYLSPDYSPAHTVYLDAFYMDKYEVTNARYKECVSAGSCTPPQSFTSRTRSAYYGNAEFDNYPVIAVTWFQAKTYCEWRDASLPTEAQWEKAARSTDERTYPWGEEFDCNKANAQDCEEDITEVGIYESGVSPYGLYDMTGNVSEWVADYYSAKYYYWNQGESSNPVGPAEGQYRIVRGGSSSYYWGIETYHRLDGRYAIGSSDIGIRCVGSQ